MLRSARRSSLVPAVLSLLALSSLLPPSIELSSEASAPPADVLQTLRAGHPRLYLLNDELARVKKDIQEDQVVRAWYERLQRDAQKILVEPPVEHKLIGPRLLSQSRAALRRISTLAGLYRLDGDRRKAARARTEMLTAAAFSDWNPSHFLDVAEMANALAIGYDWLFDFLSTDDRAIIRAAIVEKGLRQGLAAYEKSVWWTRTHNNWSQVCNGGMTAAALAIADEQPDLARAIITRARDSIVTPMRMFAPDGGCEEGPGYWNYATRYNVFYLAALQSSLGTDFGLKKMAGFADTGMFRVYATGPLKLTFNYADAGEAAGDAAQMFWLAREFNQPLYAKHELQMIGDHPSIFHLLWSGARSESARGLPLPLDAVFRGVNVAFFRSGWDDARAFYVGFKGGDNKASHSHLDLGSFVLDALGERWAIDLGPDDYDLPAYFGRQRWTYYRLRTEGHNTLTIDGENQEPSAKAPIIAFLSTLQRTFAVADLTEAYKPKATAARRGVALLNRSEVLVQDELQATQPVEIVWNFHTRAQIDLRGNRVTLSRGKAQMEAVILSPAGGRFDLLSANPQPPQAQQPDVDNLIIRLPEKTRQATIAVLLAPSDRSVALPRLEPLEAWIAAGKPASAR